MSSHELNREVISAWQRGWQLRKDEHTYPWGRNSNLGKICQQGWKSCRDGETCEEGLEKFLKENLAEPSHTVTRISQEQAINFLETGTPPDQQKSKRDLALLDLQENEHRLSEEFDRYVATAVEELKEVQRLQRFAATYPTPHDQDERNEKVHNLLLSAKDFITEACERWGS